MTAYNPSKMTNVQAQGNGGALAALAGLRNKAVTSLGDNVGQIGQDMRSNALNELIGSGALDGMDAAQAEQFLLANAGGSLNEQTNKNTQSLLANQQTEEAAALANVNALEQIGIKHGNASELQAANNLAAEDRNNVNQVMNYQNSQDKISSLEKIAKDVEAGRMERHQDWAQLGDGWIFNKKTSEFKRPDGSSFSLSKQHQDFFKSLTGNKKDYFADLSDHNKDVFMKIAELNPRLNVEPLFYTDNDGVQRAKGFTVLDGSSRKGLKKGETYTLADANAYVERYRADQKVIQAKLEKARKEKAKKNKRTKYLNSRSSEQAKIDKAKALTFQQKKIAEAKERGRKNRER